MNGVRFVKSFSKGQITIPKEMRDALGIVHEFWLKLSVQNGKIIAEPVEKEKNEETLNKTAYRKKLLALKQIFINPLGITKNRKQVEKQIAKRAL